MSRLFALVLWVNDSPVTGNVINLSTVKKPRKEPELYEVGEKVVARCQGFGDNDAVIALIEEEAKKRDLIEVLKNTEDFGRLVSIYCEANPPEQDRIVTEMPPQQLPPPETSCEEPIITGKRKSTKANVEKKTQSVLEKAASDLELTEIASAFEAVASGSSRLVPVPSSSELVGQSLQLLERQPERPVIPVPMIPGNHGDMYSSSDLAGNCSSCEALRYRLDNTESYVYQMERRLTQAETSLHWVCNYAQQMQATHHRSRSPFMGSGDHYSSSPASSASTFHSPPSPVRSAVPSPVRSAAPSPVDASDSPQQMDRASSHEDICSMQTYNGFTKDQLKAKIDGFTCYSKASKLLFRLLYTVEEYVGKSLTGSKANKKFEARPAIDQRKLLVLYDIIEGQFANITAVMIRERLRDVLKPSASRGGGDESTE